MSKAFLRESDEHDQPQLAIPVSPLPAGARNYLTAAGAEGLRSELKRLRTIERPVLAAHAQDSEAKLKLAATDQRIRYLQQSLLAAEIVEVAPGAAEVVRFGTTVIVRQHDGTMLQYRLVGVDETDPAHGAISWVSPLAQSLMNAKVGAEVTVNTPSGLNTLTIAAIRYDAE